MSILSWALGVLGCQSKPPPEVDDSGGPGLEVCNGTDDDADGEVDEDLPTFADDDGDGVGGAEVGCEAGVVDLGGDCDDADEDVHPGQPETCNATDDDCDGATDAADGDVTDASFVYVDADGDGLGAQGTSAFVACPGSGTAPNDDDCDDTDVAVGVGTTLHLDLDGDGYGDPVNTLLSCDGTGGLIDDTDCDDAHAEVHPGAPELCDGFQNDCLGTPAIELPEGTDLQALLDAASSGDAFCLDPGTYVGPFSTTLGVSIVGWAGSAATVLTVDSEARVFLFDAASPGEALDLQGLSFHGGVAVDGAGLYIDGGTADLLDLAFQGNVAMADVERSHGGGLFISNSTVVGQRLSFVSNGAVSTIAGIGKSRAGAVYARQATLALYNTSLYGNWASSVAESAGGALYCTESTVALVNVIGVANQAYTTGSGTARGGFAYVQGVGSVTLLQSVVASNTATDGGALAGEAGTYTLWNTALAQNEASGTADLVYEVSGYALTLSGSYTQYGDTTAELYGVATPGGTANTFAVADPADWFVLPATDLGSADYHLVSGSALLDAGGDSLCTDPDGSLCDIGAYGGAYAEAW